MSGMHDMNEIISLAKRRGFVFPDSEIYGGMANSWDYGPLGTLLKQNLRREWWNFFVASQPDMVGVESTIIMNPKVWEASGHLKHFTDPLVECKSCHRRFRLDQLEGEDTKTCPECGGEFTDVRQFNLMFKTFVGPVEDAASTAYLRPELAVGMFANFKNVLDSMHMRIPFGIAQQGRAFRNEITTGNFIFRTREFEIMEFEYFVHPREWEQHFERWLRAIKVWWKEVVRIDDAHLFYHEIPEGERAHYSKRTVDIEYHYPFGLKELHGIAYRTDFDLRRHTEASGVDLSYRDPVTGERYIPHVIEPTFGLDRMVLAMLLEHYSEVEGGRDAEGETKHEKEVVFRFPPKLAPLTTAVLPLLRKAPLAAMAHEIRNELSRWRASHYDETGSIGKRYRRQDEIGTPYCITVDFQSLQDNSVTVRDRDSMRQERVSRTELLMYLRSRLGDE